MFLFIHLVIYFFSTNAVLIKWQQKEEREALKELSGNKNIGPHSRICAPPKKKKIVHAQNHHGVHETRASVNFVPTTVCMFVNQS